MRIADFCILRPVFAMVMTFVILITGFVAFTRLPTRSMPKMDEPVVTVTTYYSGASPQIIESSITKLIEEHLTRVPGIKRMTSETKEGESEITLAFNNDISLIDASSDTREAVSTAAGYLPNEVRLPQVSKKDPEARAVIWVSVSSRNASVDKINNYVNKVLKPKFEVVDGVSSVLVAGADEYFMNVLIDPDKLAAYGITSNQVRNAIERQHIESPGGRIIGQKEYPVNFMANMQNPKEFADIVIDRRDGRIVKVKDVGEVELSEYEIKNKTWLNGENVVVMQVYKQSTANPLNVASNVKKVMNDLQRDLPPNINMDVCIDRSIFIQKSIDQVYQTIFEAVIFVILVILMFLWSFRATLIPLVTIPVSLIGVCFLMYLMNFSLNNLTLLAMVLAVGLVVDDAIVVEENVFVKLENGMDPVKAASEGTKEIAFAVIAMTLTLVAVYAPLGFSMGKSGAMFREFALTLCGAVLISGFVSLTLTPMMCAKMLKPIPQNPALAGHGHGEHGHDAHDGHSHGHGHSGPWILRKIDAMIQSYGYTLKGLLRRRKLILMIVGILFAAGVASFKMLPHELSPYEDKGMIDILSTPPRGTTMEYSKQYALELNKIVAKIPEVQSAVISMDNSRIDGTLVLKDWDKRKRGSQEIADELDKELSKIPGLSFSVTGRTQVLNEGGGSDDVTVYVKSQKGQEYLEKHASEFFEKVLQEGLLTDLRTTNGLHIKSYTIKINREKAAMLGVDIRELSDCIQSVLHGKKSTEFVYDGARYDVKVAMKSDARDIGILDSVFVKAEKEENKETLVPISDIIHIETEYVLQNIEHMNQQLCVKYLGKIGDKYNMATMIDKLYELKKQHLPADVTLSFGTDLEDFQAEQMNMLIIFALALVFIFLILSAQFESFIDPMIVMITVPLSLAGALITLLFVPESSVNIFTNIGAVTLIGLITKHGILLVDYANTLMQSGLSKWDAVHQSAVRRMRPILMTTLAMVLGAIPLAFSSGAGMEQRQQIGWVIVGGLSIGTLFTLFVLPIMYTFFKREYHIRRDTI